MTGLVTDAPAASSELRRSRRPTVGILALQGDVREHAAVLEAIGARACPVRSARELAGVDALVLPGGESTTMSLLLRADGLDGELAARIAGGLPVLGTCAGMILLARSLLDGRPDQVQLSAIDIVVRRNAFGRQLQSFETDLDVSGLEGGPMRAVFIRAPVVEAAADGVEVLATLPSEGEHLPAAALRGRPVVCRQGRVTVAAFHPELTGDLRLHELLLSDVEGD